MVRPWVVTEEHSLHWLREELLCLLGPVFAGTWCGGELVHHRMLHSITGGRRPRRHLAHLWCQSHRLLQLLYSGAAANHSCGCLIFYNFSAGVGPGRRSLLRDSPWAPPTRLAVIVRIHIVHDQVMTSGCGSMEPLSLTPDQRPIPTQSVRGC